MTRFVIDPSTTLQLAAEEAKVRPDGELYAPTLWRSDVLSAMYEAVRRGELGEEVARERLAYVNGLKSGCSATPCSGAVPGSWRSTSNCPRRTRRSTSRSPSSRSALS